MRGIIFYCRVTPGHSNDRVASLHSGIKEHLSHAVFDKGVFVF